MAKSVVPTHIHALIPTNAGTAVFLGSGEKVFTIYIDQGMAGTISAYLARQESERPLTHNLLLSALTALGAQVERVVISDFRNGIFFARLILTAENELMQRKIVELDARTSDGMAIAVLARAPLYVSRAVLDEVEDTSELLKRLQASQDQDTPES